MADKDGDTLYYVVSSPEIKSSTAFSLIGRSTKSFKDTVLSFDWNFNSIPVDNVGDEPFEQRYVTDVGDTISITGINNWGSSEIGPDRIFTTYDPTGNKICSNTTSISNKIGFRNIFLPSQEFLSGALSKISRVFDITLLQNANIGDSVTVQSYDTHTCQLSSSSNTGFILTGSQGFGQSASFQANFSAGSLLLTNNNFETFSIYDLALNSLVKDNITPESIGAGNCKPILGKLSNEYWSVIVNEGGCTGFGQTFSDVDKSYAGIARVGIDGKLVIDKIIN